MTDRTLHRITGAICFGFIPIALIIICWMAYKYPSVKPRFDWRTPDTRFQIAHDLAEAKRWNKDWAVNFGQPWPSVEGMGDTLE